MDLRPSGSDANKRRVDTMSKVIEIISTLLLRLYKQISLSPIGHRFCHECIDATSKSDRLWNLVLYVRVAGIFPISDFLPVGSNKLLDSVHLTQPHHRKMYQCCSHSQSRNWT